MGQIRLSGSDQTTLMIEMRRSVQVRDGYRLRVSTLDGRVTLTVPRLSCHWKVARDFAEDEIRLDRQGFGAADAGGSGCDRFGQHTRRGALRAGLVVGADGRRARLTEERDRGTPEARVGAFGSGDAERLGAGAVW